MTYIIIHKQKIIIETDGDIGLDDSEESALDKIINEDPETLEYIGDIKADELTIEQTYYLHLAYEMLRDLAGLDIDSLLIYWLKSKDIDFEVEPDIDIKEWQREGYNIVKISDNRE